MFTNKHEYLENCYQQQDNRTKEKPIVHFSRLIWKAPPGERAAIIPIDHPAVYLNGKTTYTSDVVSLDANGIDFETLNTKYVFKQQEN